MTKPAITNRVTKGAALTYAELDTNFSNLQNATIGVTDGTNTHAFNLNDTITFTAGTNVTLGVNPSTGAITVSASGGVTTGNIQWTYSGSPSYLNTMNAWVNSNDSLKIRSGSILLESGVGFSLTGSGSGSVVATNLPFNTSDTNPGYSTFFPKRQSESINTVFDTGVSMDNLNIRVHGISGSAGQLQASAVTGSFASYVTTFGNVAGQAVAGDTSSTGITFTAGTWTSCNFRYNISAGGDMITAHIMDTTNSRLYRVTVMHGNASNGAYISIERMA
jgi:hypothetical protein